MVTHHTHSSCIVRVLCSCESNPAWSNENLGWRVVALANSISIVSHGHCSVDGVVGMWTHTHWSLSVVSTTTMKNRNNRCIPFSGVVSIEGTCSSAAKVARAQVKIKVFKKQNYRDSYRVHFTGQQVCTHRCVPSCV